MTIAILGGGLAGLSAAYYLKQEGNKEPIQIIEANDYTGGWIQSFKDETTDIVTELGPRTIRGSGKSANNTYSLIKELGIEDLVRNVGNEASNRYIYAKGDIHQLPTSVLRGLFITNQPFSKPLIYYLLRECFLSDKINVKIPECQNNDESAYNFFSRRYGQEFADYLISPLLCGICGGNSKEISVKFMFDALYKAERTHGSVGLGLLKEKFISYWKDEKINNFEQKNIIKSPPSVYYLEGGLQRLISALNVSNESQGIHINLNTKCNELHFYKNNNGARIVFSNGQQLECSRVISALPAHKLASLFLNKSQHFELVQLLTSIPMVSIVTVNLFYDDPNLMNSYKGFGVLASPIEQLSLLGIIFDNYIYNKKDHVNLTVMMGGYSFKDNFVNNSKCFSKEKLTGIALDHVKRVLNIQTPPNALQTRILRNCIPQYTIGHYERVAKIHEYISNKCLPLTVIGSSYLGISINDVIYSSMTAMRKLSRR